MQTPFKTTVMMLALGLLVSACVGPQDRASTGQTAANAPTTAPKRLTAAIMGNPPHANSRITFQSSVAGMHEIDELLHAGLTTTDNLGRRIPHLAEQVPTIENGLWRMLADGRMETTWRIRPNITWHDGAPFTSDDLVFTTTLGRDPTLGGNDPLYRQVESAEAVDPHTFKLVWKETFILADTVFTREISRPYHQPVAKHLVESMYATEKTKIPELSYWSDDFVGLGPFKLREFVRGSHFLFDAFDHYMLGRPKIDSMEVRFIPDQTTALANVLAGTVDFVLGRGLSVDEAVIARGQWRDGKPLVSNTSRYWMWPKFVNPNPPIMTDLRFRRALMHAMNRQEMVDTIQSGYGGVNHSIVDPSDPDFQDAERRVTKYEYDPAKAIEMIGALGFTRGSDGMFRSSANEPLFMEIRSSQGTTDEKSLFAIADYFKRVGIATEALVIPEQMSEDREWRAAFPALAMQRGGYGPPQLPRFGTSQIPTAANRYSAPQFSAYSNAEFDALLAKYEKTIPLEERVQIFGDIVSHMTEVVNQLPLFFTVEVELVHNRLANVLPKHKDGTSAWNAHTWEIR